MSGQNVLLWLPIYGVYLTLSTWVICALGMLCAFQKELDNLWLFCSLDSQLCTYVNLYLAKVVSMG